MVREVEGIRGEEDVDLKRRVVNYLVGRQVRSLRQIEVDANNGTVVLRGRVGSYYEKQLCIHCCRRVAGGIGGPGGRGDLVASHRPYPRALPRPHLQLHGADLPGARVSHEQSNFS